MGILRRFNVFAIVIPSYREEESLKILVDDIKNTLPGIHIIIVDDSPSDEAARIRTKFSNYNNIVILTRGEKLGRGSAVIEGLRRSIINKNINYVFEMDSDLSHKPMDCYNFLSAINTADCVIGSRYVKGSCITDWPLYRYIISRIMNYIMNIILGLHLSDYTNGFRLYRRETVEFLLSINLKESGFIALSEMAYKLSQHNFRLTEVPITFRYRSFGTSSAGVREFLNTVAGTIRIRFS